MSKAIAKIEIVNESKILWLRLSASKQAIIQALPFVEKVSSHWLYIQANQDPDEVRRTITKELRKLLNRKPDLVVHEAPVPNSVRLQQAIKSKAHFKSLSFGADTAEQDTHLSEYFVTTDAFQKALSGQKSVVIGPKGSGKSAILKALATNTNNKASHSIVIVPNSTAMSQLQFFVNKFSHTPEAQEAFTSAWVFTILIEVIRRITENMAKSDKKRIQKVTDFLEKYSEYEDGDVFTKFIRRLSEVERIRFGDFEINFKTKELQNMYSLKELYEIVPLLQKAIVEDILVLIDELDHGWDNSAHANKFVASLMQAAILVQNMGLKLRVIAFLRLEIFDIVKCELEHLDKLRHNIEYLKWSPKELAAIVIRRAAYSLGIPQGNIEFDFINTIFSESVSGKSGFEYIVSRTTRRPREILQFVRLSHTYAVDRGDQYFTRNSILRAEGEYSNWKLEHTAAEYKHILPGLKDFLCYFQTKGPLLSRDDIANILERFNSDYCDARHDWLKQGITPILQWLYSIEFVGIERTSVQSANIHDRYLFAYSDPTAKVHSVQHFAVHPAFWSALDIAEVM